MISGGWAADRMGLLPEIRRRGYVAREVRIVDQSGKRISGFSVESLSRVVQGRYISLARSDLAASIYNAIEGKVETIFNDSIARIEQAAQGVHVTLETGIVRDFDFVIGADGLHSRVRDLVFGPQNQFEKYLGYKVAAFEIEGYRPRDESTFAPKSKFSMFLRNRIMNLMTIPLVADLAAGRDLADNLTLPEYD